MCSTRAWAAVVKSIMGYPGADLDTPVSAVWQNNGIEHIKLGGGAPLNMSKFATSIDSYETLESDRTRSH